MTPNSGTGRARRTCSGLVALVLAGLALLVGVPPASAATPLTTTSTTATVVPPDATTPLPGVAVAGADDETTVQATVATDRGTLALDYSDAVELAYGNSWSGDASITVTGLRPDLNAVLATLTITTGADTGVTAEVTVTALVSQPGYVYAPSNQHFYEYVPEYGITNGAARTAARQRTFLGQPGYLATMPSAELNDLVSTRIEGATNVWFGARSIDTPGQFPARRWVWGDGPLADQTLTACENLYDSCSHVEKPGVYSSWYPGEPNNAGGEYVGVTNWSGSYGYWNDLPDNAGFSISGYVVEYGDQVVGGSTFSGIVTAAAEVAIQGVPAAPTEVSAIRGDGTATVTFAAPVQDGGSAVTGYTVTTTPGGATSSCAASPCTVSGLTNGTTYSFTVTAENALGSSALSAASNEVVPGTVPGAPTGVAVVSGDGSLTVTFTAPESDGGLPVLGYVVTVAKGEDEVLCPGSPCVVTGLENGTSYDVRVRARNDAGDSPATASVRAVPLGTPAAPTEVSAVRGKGSATVSFTAPTDDGGTEVTGYQVSASPGGLVVDCTDSPCVVPGLTNGTAYTFTVRAANSVGLSPASEPSAAVTPATVPAAPTGLEVERGDESATLTFGAPADDGGSDVTGYEYRLRADGDWLPLVTTGSKSLTATLSGLTNGTTYAVQVRAVNEVGPGEAVAETSVTPARRPDAPTDVAAVRGDGQLTVSFTAPDSNGAEITSYTVTASPGGATATCPGSPCVLVGLENGTPYAVTVVATNEVGTSAASDPSSAVAPAGVPSAPTLRSVVATAGALLIELGVPKSDHGDAVTGYEVSVDGGLTFAPLALVGEETKAGVVTGLQDGTRYAVVVRALNGVGPGASSATLTGTPASLPGPVRDVTVTVADGRPTVRWKAPVWDGGAEITGYRVVAAPGGQVCTSTTTSCTFAGLPTGVTYTFAVSAVNTDRARPATGTGPAVVSARVTVTARPSAPRGLAVTPGDRRLSLAFTPPADDGGTRVTGYQVSLNGGKSWSTVRPTGGAPLRVTVAPVLNGARFSVAVRARNANGYGPRGTVVKVATAQWFRDPVSASDRKKQIKVPAKPTSYRGPSRATTAAYRSANGTVAVPGTSLKGRQLQPGQAVNLGDLFAFDDAELSSRGRNQIKAVATSLRYVGALTCEGYADYGGKVSQEEKLARTRASEVCDLLHRYAPQVDSLKTAAYGPERPAVVGGSRSDRAANRRVVVLVRG